jgi:hypothetical protein
VTTDRPLPDGISANLEELAASLRDYSREDVWGFAYEFRIGRVFSLISLAESTIIDALGMCKNVTIDGEPDAESKTDRMMWRRSVLQDQTFGNLIKVLSRNSVSAEGLSYFRFLKRVRDRFVHRFFEDHVFPGEMRECHFVRHMRDLRCLELIFWRSTHRIWKILGHEKYDRVTDLGANGLLIWNEFDDSPD